MISVDLPEKPGKGRQFLEDNYLNVPSEHVKNGHVLFLYATSNKSVTETARMLTQKLSANYKALPQDVHALVRRTQKLCLSRDKEMTKYSVICQEMFPLKLLDKEPSVPSSSRMSPHPSVPSSSSTPRPLSPAPSTSTAHADISGTSTEHPTLSSRLRSSSRDSTPRKVKLRRRLSLVSQFRSEEKVKHRSDLKKIRAKVKDKTPIKYLKQQLKRKDLSLQKSKAIITELKAKLQNDAQTPIVKKLQRTNAALKRHNNKLRETTVPLAAFEELERKFKDSQETLTEFQHENLLLKEQLENATNPATSLKADGKKYSTDARMIVFDLIATNVSTGSIPTVMHNMPLRLGKPLDTVPQRNTVEMMGRELGALSDFQSADYMLNNRDLTLGFDATTQEGVHINSVHVTTKDTCHIIGVDQLPGGTAVDYEHHIVQCIDNVVDVYCSVTNEDFNTVKSVVIGNIANTMTDRASVNHATVVRLEERWGKKLNELNCHLHPLDTIASSCRSSLKRSQTESGKLFGNDCLAGNVIISLNKMRYKDGKGDPRSFVAFLDRENLPRGLIQRYRGNRLHVLFDLCAKYHQHYDSFVNFLSTSVLSCVTLQKVVLADFKMPATKMQFHVLGLIGKVISGPWMTALYTSPEDSVQHLDAIQLVKQVRDTARAYLEKPMDVLSMESDFFGNPLGEDNMMTALRSAPDEPTVFATYMKNCLLAVIEVIERQYSRYFEMDVTEKLREETETARCHNMDAEEIMGMVSSAKSKAPSATLCYLSCKVRAQKNHVIAYLDDLPKEERDTLLNACITIGRRQRKQRRQNVADVTIEVQRRLSEKVEKKAQKERKKTEKTLRKENVSVGEEFPELDEATAETVTSIILGRVVGWKICHLWYDQDLQRDILYTGRVEKLKKNNKTYKISYWNYDEGETEDVGVQYDIDKYSLAADMVANDVWICN